MSDTTNGLKSVLLKVVTPLWRKHNGERSVPFEISGTDIPELVQKRQRIRSLPQLGAIVRRRFCSST